MQNLSRNIAEVALSAAKRWPEKTAIDDHGTRLTFAELADGAQLAARAFIASGIDAGDRFAIWAPNIHEWIQVALGGLMAGGVLVPLNTRYKGIEAAGYHQAIRRQVAVHGDGFFGYGLSRSALRVNLFRVLIKSCCCAAQAVNTPIWIPS